MSTQTQECHPSQTSGNPLATCPNTVSPPFEVQITNNGLEPDLHTVSGRSLTTHPTRSLTIGKFIEKDIVHMTSDQISTSMRCRFLSGSV